MVLSVKGTINTVRFPPVATGHSGKLNSPRYPGLNDLQTAEKISLARNLVKKARALSVFETSPSPGNSFPGHSFPGHSFPGNSLPRMAVTYSQTVDINFQHVCSSSAQCLQGFKLPARLTVKSASNSPFGKMLRGPFPGLGGPVHGAPVFIRKVFEQTASRAVHIPEVGR